MSRMILIRHGPTHAKSMVGWSDLPADLSDHAAVGRLAAELPGDALVVSSDLSRAIATADAIQGDRARLPHRRALREMFFGAWELRRWVELDAEDPERIRAFWETPGDLRAPGGESWNAFRARVDGAVDRLRADHPGRDLVLVAHFGVVLSQVQRALDLPATEAFGHRIDPLSLTEIDTGPKTWAVGRINHRA
jgi:broad specificity phosphatase PhoE